MTSDTFTSQSHKRKGMTNWQPVIYHFHPKSCRFKVVLRQVSLLVFSFSVSVSIHQCSMIIHQQCYIILIVNSII